MARCGAVASWAALGRAQQLAKPGALLRTNKSERSSGAIYFAHLVFFFKNSFLGRTMSVGPSEPVCCFSFPSLCIVRYR